MAIVPNMMSMNKNRTMTSNMIGREFRMVATRELMFGIWLIVLRGRKIRITLIAEMSPLLISELIHPRITTLKSMIFQESLR